MGSCESGKPRSSGSELGGHAQHRSRPAPCAITHSTCCCYSSIAAAIFADALSVNLAPQNIEMQGRNANAAPCAPASSRPVAAAVTGQIACGRRAAWRARRSTWATCRATSGAARSKTFSRSAAPVFLQILVCPFTFCCFLDLCLVLIPLPLLCNAHRCRGGPALGARVDRCHLAQLLSSCQACCLRSPTGTERFGRST